MERCAASLVLWEWFMTHDHVFRQSTLQLLCRTGINLPQQTSEGKENVHHGPPEAHNIMDTTHFHENTAAVP